MAKRVCFEPVCTINLPCVNARQCLIMIAGLNEDIDSDMQPVRHPRLPKKGTKERQMVDDLFYLKRISIKSLEASI